MSIIDIHTHVWPDRAAERALADSIDDLSGALDGVASLAMTETEAFLR